MPQKKIILAGGSGFIGSAMAHRLAADGWSVVILTRRPREGRTDGISEVAWDGRTVDAWTAELNDAAAVVNLAGRNINCRHTPSHRAEILESRVSSVLAITAAIAASSRPPAVLIQSSAIGIFGDAGEHCCTEDSLPGTGFIPQTCQLWEQALLRHPTPATRQAILRIGLVLGAQGGLLEPLGRLTRWGLGGAVGSGQQWMSWIHLADMVGIIQWLISRSDATGVFLGAAPTPVRNKDFMRALRHALHRPWSPPVPALAVRLGAGLLGTEADLALQGCRCQPRRLLEMGYTFQYPDLPGALAEIYAPQAGR